MGSARYTVHGGASRTCLDCSSNVPWGSVFEQFAEVALQELCWAVTTVPIYMHMGMSVQTAVEAPVTFHIGTLLTGRPRPRPFLLYFY